MKSTFSTDDDSNDPLPHHISKRNSLMFKYLLAVLNDEEGASLVEYALIVALVAVVAIAGLKILGSNANTALSSAATTISS
jgi:pilus assembly protein Flp/PilA